MRIQINCKAHKNFKIPFNYNYILSSIIYSKIHDLNIARRLHDKNGFKFFTFSPIHIPKKRIRDNLLCARNGKFNFTITSPNTELLQTMIKSYTTNPILNFNSKYVEVESVQALPEPTITSNMCFVSKSPIYVKGTRIIDNVERVWDLAPSEEKFYKQLEGNLIRKYKDYYNLTSTDLTCSFSSQLRNVKQKRILIKKPEFHIPCRAYYMDINLTGDSELIRFAYDAGVGDRCSMGFGMLTVKD